MSLKAFNAASITTDGKFSAAIKDVFTGITARNQQIQQLLVIALFKAQAPASDDPARTVDDFRWLSMLADSFEGCRGLSLQQFTDYIKAHVHTVDGKSLRWDSKTKQFKKPEKGVLMVYKPLAGTWFEFGKKPTIASQFNLDKSFHAVLNKAAKAAKEGALSPEDLLLFNKIKAAVMQPSQIATQTAAQQPVASVQVPASATPQGALDPAQAAAQGVC